MPAEARGTKPEQRAGHLPGDPNSGVTATSPREQQQWHRSTACAQNHTPHLPPPCFISPWTKRLRAKTTAEFVNKIFLPEKRALKPLTATPTKCYFSNSQVSVAEATQLTQALHCVLLAQHDLRPKTHPAAETDSQCIPTSGTTSLPVFVEKARLSSLTYPG